MMMVIIIIIIIIIIQDMTTFWKCKYNFTHSALTLDETEWSASLHGRFKPGENIPITQKIESWLDLRASLDTQQFSVVQPITLSA
jgi:hypothetical protein